MAPKNNEKGCARVSSATRGTLVSTPCQSSPVGSCTKSTKAKREHKREVERYHISAHNTTPHQRTAHTDSNYIQHTQATRLHKQPTMAATTTTMTTVTMNEVETRGTAPELTSEGTLNGKVTPGEELFLVHLTRQAGDDEDEDAAVAVEQPGRKRATSIGEELWSVHLKRDAQSMSEEDDGDDVEDVINDKDKADENDKAMGTGDVNSGDTDSEEPPTKRQAVVPQDKDTKVDD